jgi:hypothetical protein
VSRPKRALIEGAQILARSLGQYGFQFQFREEGQGSGGAFAWGEFVRGGRKLELHFRFNLGMVRYHADDQSASHESYMRELDLWNNVAIPVSPKTPPQDSANSRMTLLLPTTSFPGTPPFCDALLQRKLSKR